MQHERLWAPFLANPSRKTFRPSLLKATKMHKKKKGWMAKKCLDKAGREDALHGKSARAGSQPVL